MRRFVHVAIIAALTVTLAAQHRGGSKMKLTTKAFSPGAEIPQKYTCQGEDVSPALEWSDVPATAVSFALIADDPDAPVGTWVHWVLYDLPTDTRTLPEGQSKGEHASGGVQGRNDFKKLGYGGPCPPPGKAHRYFFKLYALREKLGLKPGATKQDVENAMKGKIIEQAEVIGTYKRK